MANGMPQSCAQCANNNNQNAPSPQRQNGRNNGQRNSAPPSGNAGGQCQPSSKFDQSNGCDQGDHFDQESQSCVPPPTNCQVKNRSKLESKISVEIDQKFKN